MNCFEGEQKNFIPNAIFNMEASAALSVVG